MQSVINPELADRKKQTTLILDIPKEQVSKVVSINQILNKMLQFTLYTNCLTFYGEER